MNEGKLNEMIRTSLDQIREIAGGDTVTGTPIQTNSGTVIIPVSKISMGYASGGVDYTPKAQQGKDSAQNKNTNRVVAFSGGGGTGISITPLCFLVVKENGDVEMLNIADNRPIPPAVGVIDSVTNLLEKSPEIIGKLKGAFAKSDDPAQSIDDLTIEEMDEKAISKEIAKEQKRIAKVAKLRAKAAKADAKAAQLDAKAAKADAKAADLEVKANEAEEELRG